MACPVLEKKEARYSDERSIQRSKLQACYHAPTVDAFLLHLLPRQTSSRACLKWLASAGCSDELTSPRSLRHRDRHGTTHTNHAPPPLAAHTHSHTQGQASLPGECDGQTSDKYREKKKRPLKKRNPASPFARNDHRKRARDRRPPHLVPTTIFTRTAPLRFPSPAVATLYKRTQCSNCSLHQTPKKAGPKSPSHVRSERTYREKRAGRPLEEALCRTAAARHKMAAGTNAKSQTSGSLQNRR